MSGKEVNRYLALLDRKLFIVAHSGVEWEPEYGPEMEAIDQELAELRKLVDQEHERRRGVEKEAWMKAFASESEFDKAYERFLADLPQASGVIRRRHKKMEASFRDYLDAFEKWLFRHTYEAGYAAAMAVASGAGQQWRQGGDEEGTVMEQLRREALYAQRSYSEELLYKIYGGAVMARKLGAITKEEFMEVNDMTVRFMNTDHEFIRRKNEEFFHGGTAAEADGDGQAKEYRVKYWDRDGVVRYREFDDEERAKGFYDRLDGKAEVQRYVEERQEYEAVVYPEFEV